METEKLIEVLQLINTNLEFFCEIFVVLCIGKLVGWLLS